MGRRRCLVMHKNEWDRLKRQAGPPEEPIKDDNDYIKGLIEKSQRWIRTWPDTVEGHVAKIEKLKEKQHEDEIANLKAFTKKKRQENTAEAIKKAKQMIFEDSCYGKKLKSALIESKTLEERDVQIQFQKDIKMQAADLENRQTMLEHFSTFDLDEKSAYNEHKSKLKAIECAQTNKEITEIKKQEYDTMIKKEKDCNFEVILIKQVFDREAKQKEETKLMEKKAAEEFLAERRKIKELKAKREEYDKTLTEAYRKDQENIKCKIQRVYDQVHKGRQDTPWSKSCFETIEKIQDVEKKRYDQLVEKGIEDLEQRNYKQEQENAEKQKRGQYIKCLISQRNKIYGEIERKSSHTNKCFCDRQSLITKSHKIPMKKAYEYVDEDLHNTNPSFLDTRNKLVDELKKREKEPSPWNGANAAHAQFAREANDTLEQCKYKHLARKVIDEYRRLNALDSDKLPVPNY